MRGPDRCDDVFRGANHVPLLVIGDTSSNPLLDIEAPRKLVQLALGELGDVDISPALRLHRDGGFDGLSRIAPQIELASREKEEGVLKAEDEGAAVELEKGERRGKPTHSQNERYRYVHRQNAPKNVCGAEPSHHVYELFEGKGPENLVLYFDELRNLKLHTLIISVLEGASRALFKQAAHDTDRLR